MYPQNIYYSVMNRIVLPQWSYFTARKSSNQGSPMSRSKIRHTYFTFQTARSYVRFLRSMGLTSNWHSTEVIFRFSSSLTQRLHSWCSMVAKRLHCKTESPQFKSHFWLKKKNSFRKMTLLKISPNEGSSTDLTWLLKAQGSR